MPAAFADLLLYSQFADSFYHFFSPKHYNLQNLFQSYSSTQDYQYFSPSAGCSGNLMCCYKHWHSMQSTKIHYIGEISRETVHVENGTYIKGQSMYISCNLFHVCNTKKIKQTQTYQIDSLAQKKAILPTLYHYICNVSVNRWKQPYLKSLKLPYQ